MSGCHIENIVRFGFFGKLPINGDFIQRNLPVHFVHRWDGWLQENLSACQQALEGSWLKHYLTSPIWRFFIAPSVIDDNAYIGIFGPSVDSVGRYFPMTLVTPIPAKYVPSLFSTAFQTIFSELETLFLKYLNADSNTGTISVETLSKELTQHSAKLQKLLVTQNLDLLPESLDCHRFILSDQSDIAGATSSLWLMHLMRQHTGLSLWWSNGSHAIEPSLLVNRGLPNKHQFTSMLAGFNNNNHWRQKQLSIALIQEDLPEAQSDTDLMIETETSATDNLLSEHDSIVTHKTIPKQKESPPTPNDDHSSETSVLFNDNDDSSKQLLDNFLNNAEATTPTLTQSNAGFSEIGHKRTENQDAILIHKSQSMWVVADGMGGHSEGDKASQAIVDQLSQLDLKGDLISNIEQIKGVLNQVNRLILEFAKTKQTTCGSTVVILLRNHNQCAYLWAGDSRLYLSRNGQLRQLTKDHSLDNGLPQKNNAITRAVGVYENLDIECGFHQLLSGDRFLLCSDGVYDSISEEQIKNALNIASPFEASNYLKKHVLESTAKDNLSGTLVWF